MVRIYCLTSFNTIKNECRLESAAADNPINTGADDYFSTAQWDNDGISSAEKIEQNLHILENFHLTEISIGYDFINETNERIYLMFIYRNDIGLLVIKMIPGAVRFHSVSNKSFDLFIATSMIFNKKMHFDLLIRVTCIKNTKTRGVIDAEEKSYYEDYANKIEAFCNGDKTLRETAFEILPFNLPNQTRNNVLRQKLSDFSILIRLLCDEKIGNITNIQGNQRYNQKIKCLLQINYERNAGCQELSQIADSSSKNTKKLPSVKTKKDKRKVEIEKKKVVSHFLEEREVSAEKHQNFQESSPMESLEIGVNEMAAKSDNNIITTCSNQSSSLINSIPINLNSFSQNSLQISFNQSTPYPYILPPSIQQPINLVQNEFNKTQNLLSFLSQPPNLHIFNPTINQDKTVPSNIGQSSIFDYSNNQLINSEMLHFLQTPIYDYNKQNSQDFIKYLLLQNLFNQSNKNLLNNNFIDENEMTKFLSSTNLNPNLNFQNDAIQINNNNSVSSFNQQNLQYSHEQFPSSSNKININPMVVMSDNVMFDTNTVLQNINNMAQPQNYSNLINDVPLQLIGENLNNRDTVMKENDNNNIGSLSVSTKNLKTPRISTPKIYQQISSFSDTELSQTTQNPPSIQKSTEEKNSEPIIENSMNLSPDITKMKVSRGRPKIYQSDKKRKEARLKSSKKYNEKRSLQTVTIKAELEAAIAILEMETEGLKNKMEDLKKSAKKMLEKNQSLIPEIDKNLLKLID